MEQKTKFITGLLDGDEMAPLCREVNVSRKTGYQIWEKYHQFGQDSTCDHGALELTVLYWMLRIVKSLTLT